MTDNLKPYYFTFGSDPQFPYGLYEYVQVMAENERAAREKFGAKYPSRPGYTGVNCAFIYDEVAWRDVYEKWYKAKMPSDIIW